MHSVDFVLKIGDIDEKNGTITALDSYMHFVYLGTNTGKVLQIAVEGVPDDYDVISSSAIEFAPPSPLTSVFANVLSEKDINEALKGTVQTRRTGVKLVRHSTSRAILFVLTDSGLLTMWNSAQMTFLSILENDVSTFCLHQTPTTSRERRATQRTEDLMSSTANYSRSSTPFSDRSVSSHSTLSDEPDRNAGDEESVQRIYIASDLERFVTLLEVDPKHEKNPVVAKKNRYVVPETVLSLQSLGSNLCVALSQEYSVVNTLSGVSRSVLRLTNEQKPLYELSGNEAFMTYNKSVCWTTTDKKSTVKYSTAGNDVGVATALHYPFLFVFDETVCSVFYLVDKTWVGEFPFSECCQTSPHSFRNFLFVASKRALSMIHVSSLKNQLASLLRDSKLKQTFALLSAFSSKLPEFEYKALVDEVRLSAGFISLRAAQFRQAMQYFSTKLDPRCLLLHIPETLPSSVRSFSTPLQLFLAHGRPYASVWCAVKNATIHEVPGRVCVHCFHESEGATLANSSSHFWKNFAGPCCYDTVPLPEAWVHHYRCSNRPPKEDKSKSTSSAAEGSEVFLRKCWDDFKRALYDHLIAWRAKKSLSVHPSWRCSIDEALLVLCLECDNFRLAYEIVNTSEYIQVRDLHDLLLGVEEYRLLALLFYRRGCLEECKTYLDKSTTFTCSEKDQWRSVRIKKDTRIFAVEVLFSELRHRVKSLRVEEEKQLSESNLRVSDLFLKHGGSMQFESHMLEYFSEETNTSACASFPLYVPSSCIPSSFIETSPLPKGLSEFFYLCDHFASNSLFELIQSDPSVLFSLDEHGCTLVHHLLLDRLGLCLLRSKEEERGLPFEEEKDTLQFILEVIHFFCSDSLRALFFFEYCYDDFLSFLQTYKFSYEDIILATMRSSLTLLLAITK